MNKSGRPVDVVGVHRVKADNLEHEVLTTEFLLDWPLDWYQRGRELEKWVRNEIRPDAVIVYPITIYVEVELTRKDRLSLEKRMQVYEDIEGYVLWVTNHPERLKRLKAFAKQIRERALFALLTDECWHDAEGKTLDPRQLLDNG